MTPADCRAKRRRLGLSERQLATRAGLVEQTVVRFETGATAPRPMTLIALRRAFRGLEREDPEPSP